MIDKELIKNIGIEENKLSEIIDLILEKVNAVIDNVNYIRPEFKQRLKFQIYKGLHYEY